LAEHHQLGGTDRQLNFREERTMLEQFVVGAANIAYNMGKPSRKLVAAQGGGVGQCIREEKVVYH